jgi:hypothetical protein
MPDFGGRFDWFYGLEDDYISPTFSLIEGADQGEVIHRLGGEIADLELMSAKESVDRVTQETDLIGLGEDGGFTFTVEAISSTLSVPGVLRDLSRGGRCLSVAFSVEGTNAFHYAVGGDLVVYVEDVEQTVNPLRAGDPRWNPSWCDVLADFDSSSQHSGVHLLVLMEQVMGLTAKASWANERLKTLRVPNSIRFADTPAWDIP